MNNDLIKTGLSVLILVCLLTNSNAQNFSYSMVKDSGSYVQLTSPTIISTNDSWTNKKFKIILPFQFNLCGNLSDSIFVEPNGFILFDKNTLLSIVAFNEFSSKKDTNQSYTSTIGFTVEGTAGNRTVKIQFNNLAKSMLSISDHLNYQVWLYENGNKIEFHIGSNSYAVNEEPYGQLLGLINRNMNSDPSGYLVHGIPYAPSAQSVNSTDNLIYLNNIPFEGVVLRLTPTF